MLVRPVVIVLTTPARHAGYSYSGPPAAYAYKAWDVSNV